MVIFLVFFSIYYWIYFCVFIWSAEEGVILRIHVSETFPPCVIVFVKTLKWLLCQ